MLAGHTHRILEAAAEDSINRIRKDHQKAPQRLKPLLAYIEEHLFDPSLDVNQLKRNCGVRDNSVPIQFHSSVGRPPHGYIEDRRLETACKLLAESNLKIWQISELLGYSSIQVFSRAFSRWSGQRPTSYRKKARLSQANENPYSDKARPTLEESLLARTETLRKALAGELSIDEANELILRLRQMYPEPEQPITPSPSASGSQSPNPTLPTGGEGALMNAQADPAADLWETKTKLEVLLNDSAEIDAAQSEEIWRELQKHTWQEQSSLIRDLQLTDPSLFHLLRVRSRMVGRENPRRGVQVADLALKCLDIIDPTCLTNTELASLKAQGWAWLGNARCLTGDARSAEQAFATARRFLSRGEENSLVEADILFFEANLRRDQRQFADAWELLDQADDLYRQADHRDQMCAVLICKATVRHEEGDAVEAIPFLEEALSLMNEETEGYLRLAAFHNLVAAYAETGRYSQALELLPRTRQLSAQFGRGYHRIRLLWLEGLILRGRGQYDEAEAALLEAREAFARADDATGAALVCLDIAALLWRQSRLADLEQLSASMVPLFSALQHEREAYASLQLFYRAAQESNLTTVVLDKARRALNESKQATMLA